MTDQTAQSAKTSAKVAIVHVPFRKDAVTAFALAAQRMEAISS